MKVSVSNSKPKDMRARIAGKPWRIQFLPVRYDGQCLLNRRVMEIRRSLDGRKLMETMVHEALHAAHWQIDEEYVHETAADIARILWRLGYRRQEE